MSKHENGTSRKVTLKEWRYDTAARLGIKPESMWMRLKRGLHPEVRVEKISHQRQFVIERSGSKQ